MTARQSSTDPVRRRAIVYTQDGCLTHRNISKGGAKHSLERPERLYAVNAGVAAIYARLEDAASQDASRSGSVDAGSADAAEAPFTIVRSTARIHSIAEHPAACTVLHIKPEDGPTYAQVLEEWCKLSRQRITHGERELPPEFEQDLYLCPKSFDTFKAAMGTVCEAVDAVAAGSKAVPSRNSPDQPYGTRAFVAIRPPGHHCISGAPAGLGFINTVAVGAIHAFYQHGYTHVVILDIDLHHGNGTQQVVWDINAQREANQPHTKDGFLTVFYGSIHDIQSYPCAGGTPANVTAASLSLQGEGGQWIENVHLEPYSSEYEFWTHYQQKYMTLVERATQFVTKTQALKEKTIVLLSCGFSASVHEHTEMSQHGCYMPTSFYHRFTKHVCAFADRFAQGRVVSILEGGYSNLALISGVMAHMAGLAEQERPADSEWWSPEALAEVEKTLKRLPKRKAQADKSPPWVTRARQIVELLNTPLDTDEQSPVLDIPRRDPGLKTASTPLMLSTVPSKSTKKRQAAAQGTTAPKRPRTGPANLAGPIGRSPSYAFSELTPVPDTPPKIVLPGSATSENRPVTQVQPLSVPTSQLRASLSVAPSIHPSVEPESCPVQPAHPPEAKAQEAYAELKHSFESFSGIVASVSALPQPFLRAIRPVGSCIRRLEHILAEDKRAQRALETLEELLLEAHSALEQFVVETADERGARKLDKALYDLEGAALDLRDAYT